VLSFDAVRAQIFSGRSLLAIGCAQSYRTISLLHARYLLSSLLVRSLMVR